MYHLSPQGRFENTLTGMMEALAEIKGKGDLMMGAIRGQRELLFDVRGEVREAEERLAMVERRRNEEEKMMREATSRRIMAEAKVNILKSIILHSRPPLTPLHPNCEENPLPIWPTYTFQNLPSFYSDEDDPAGEGGVGKEAW